MIWFLIIEIWILGLVAIWAILRNKKLESIVQDLCWLWEEGGPNGNTDPNGTDEGEVRSNQLYDNVRQRFGRSMPWE